MNIPAGTNTLDMFSQPEYSVGTKFTGAKLKIAFTDGTSLTATIPASSISIPAAHGNGIGANISSSVATALDAVLNLLKPTKK